MKLSKKLLSLRQGKIDDLYTTEILHQYINT